MVCGQAQSRIFVQRGKDYCGYSLKLRESSPSSSSLFNSVSGTLSVSLLFWKTVQKKCLISSIWRPLSDIGTDIVTDDGNTWPWQMCLCAPRKVESEETESDKGVSGVRYKHERKCHSREWSRLTLSEWQSDEWWRQTTEEWESRNGNDDKLRKNRTFGTDSNTWPACPLDVIISLTQDFYRGMGLWFTPRGHKSLEVWVQARQMCCQHIWPLK